jgi:PmbA protein
LIEVAKRHTATYLGLKSSIFFANEALRTHKFMDQLIDLEKLQRQAGALVAAAQSAGADNCDCIVAHGQSLHISVRDGQVENTERSEGDNLALRVLVGNRVATVNAGAREDPEMLAERAVAMARVSPPDPYQGLAPLESLASAVADLDLFDGEPGDREILVKRALECEAAGKAVDGVSRSMGASAAWGVTGFVLATSAGFSRGYRKSRFSASAAMVAGEGTAMERDYDFRSRVHQADLGDIAEIGAEAGRRAVRRRNPRQARSGKAPVIFDQRVSRSLLGTLCGAIDGAAVARKTSFLRDSMAKPVANPAITVHDDPLVRRGLGSRPFDGEGVAGQAITLVDSGILQTWLLDWAAARELQLGSNGRATRSGAGTSPSTTNCYIAAGADSPAEMIASVDHGLYLTETIGHGVNMVTGDYSKGAAGFWIENGEIAYPVSEITIAGNLKEIFLTMIPASDLEFRHASNAPTLFVEGLTIGGI